MDVVLVEPQPQKHLEMPCESLWWPKLSLELFCPKRVIQVMAPVGFSSPWQLRAGPVCLRSAVTLLLFPFHLELHLLMVCAVMVVVQGWGGEQVWWPWGTNPKLVVGQQHPLAPGSSASLKAMLDSKPQQRASVISPSPAAGSALGKVPSTCRL